MNYPGAELRGITPITEIFATFYDPPRLRRIPLDEGGANIPEFPLSAQFSP